MSALVLLVLALVVTVPFVIVVPMFLAAARALAPAGQPKLTLFAPLRMEVTW